MDTHTHNLLYIYICLFTYILYTVYIFSNFEYSIYPNRHLPKLEDPPHIHPYVVHKRQSNKTFDVMHQVFSSTEPRWRCIWGVCNCWVDGGKERFQNYLRFIGSFLSWTNHLCSNLLRFQILRRNQGGCMFSLRTFLLFEGSPAIFRYSYILFTGICWMRWLFTRERRHWLIPCL